MSVSPSPRQKLKEKALLALGTLFLALGAVGALVPVLPTTPFLLLAAACYLSSSRKMYAWLVHHPRFGAHIQNYQRHRAISLQVKLVTLALAWVSVGLTAVFVVQNLPLRIFLFLLLVSKTIFMMKVKTASPPRPQAPRVEEDSLPGA